MRFFPRTFFSFVSSGLITSISFISSGTGGQIFVGVLMLFVGLGFGMAALADFYMLVKVSSIIFLIMSRSRNVRFKI